MPTNHGLFCLFFDEFEVCDFVGVVVMGLDADDVDAGGEGGDVEVGGIAEGGHLAAVHIHYQNFDNLVVCAYDVDLAGGGVRHQTRICGAVLNGVRL